MPRADSLLNTLATAAADASPLAALASEKTKITRAQNDRVLAAAGGDQSSQTIDSPLAGLIKAASDAFAALTPEDKATVGSKAVRFEAEHRDGEKCVAVALLALNPMQHAAVSGNPDGDRARVDLLLKAASHLEAKKRPTIALPTRRSSRLAAPNQGDPQLTTKDTVEAPVSKYSRTTRSAKKTTTIAATTASTSTIPATQNTTRVSRHPPKVTNPFTSAPVDIGGSSFVCQRVAAGGKISIKKFHAPPRAVSQILSAPLPAPSTPSLPSLPSATGSTVATTVKDKENGLVVVAVAGERNENGKRTMVDAGDEATFIQTVASDTSRQVKRI